MPNRKFRVQYTPIDESINGIRASGDRWRIIEDKGSIPLDEVVVLLALVRFNTCSHQVTGSLGKYIEFVMVVKIQRTMRLRCRWQHASCLPECGMYDARLLTSVMHNSPFS